MTRWASALSGLLAVALLAGCAGSSAVKGSSLPRPGAGPLCGTRRSPPSTYQHVIWLLQENQSENEVVGSKEHPYLNSTLIARCGLAANYHNTSHPSLPNYLAMVSGAATGVADSSNCPPAICAQPQPSIFDQVQASGRQWRQYAQSEKTNCSPTTTALYEPEHAVPVYFPALQDRCATWHVPLGTTAAGALRNDIDRGSLPAFAFITPDGDHDGGTTGDQWLDDWISLLTSTADYQAGNTAIFVTWDEGGGSDKINGERCADAQHVTTAAYPSCWVATVAISPSTAPGTTSSINFTHFSMLHTTQELLGLSPFLGAAANATSMRSAFNL